MSFDNVIITIKNKIRDAMLYDLQCSLTVGREDEGLEPYNTKEFTQFVHEHNNQIDNAVNAMFDAYEHDKELDVLDSAEYDWYREFLYDYIKLPK